MSIAFQVPVAVRSGTFASSGVYNGGFSEIFWNWNIPNPVDFNNAGNSIATQVGLDNNPNWGTSQWIGGLGLGKNGFPGSVQFNISGWVSGQVFSVAGTISGDITSGVGIASGLISNIQA